MEGLYVSRTTHDDTIYLEDGSMYHNSNTVYKEEPINIAKIDDENHLVFGWANVSVDKSGDIPLDWQGDISSPEVLEKAAYKFVLKHRVSGENHEGEAKGYLIESVMITKEKMQAMGIPEGTVPEGWWVGFFVPDDEVCKKIKSGEYKMFSIQGKAKRLVI